MRSRWQGRPLTMPPQWRCRSFALALTRAVIAQSWYIVHSSFATSYLGFFVSICVVVSTWPSIFSVPVVCCTLADGGVVWAVSQQLHSDWFRSTCPQSGRLDRERHYRGGLHSGSLHSVGGFTTVVFAACGFTEAGFTVVVFTALVFTVLVASAMVFTAVVFTAWVASQRLVAQRWFSQRLSSQRFSSQRLASHREASQRWS